MKCHFKEQAPEINVSEVASMYVSDKIIII